MAKELFSLAERISTLRENSGLTQVELARIVGISRSGVNAWEMGISSPSTQYIVELSKIFKVSTDYLLGLDEHSTISVKELSPKQIAALLSIIDCFKNEK